MYTAIQKIFSIFLKEVSYAHEGCIYLKTSYCEILLKCKKINKYSYYSCDGKAEFSASLLQCHMILQK